MEDFLVTLDACEGHAEVNFASRSKPISYKTAFTAINSSFQGTPEDFPTALASGKGGSEIFRVTLLLSMGFSLPITFSRAG